MSGESSMQQQLTHFHLLWKIYGFTLLSMLRVLRRPRALHFSFARAHVHTEDSAMPYSTSRTDVVLHKMESWYRFRGCQMHKRDRHELEANVHCRKDKHVMSKEAPVAPPLPMCCIRRTRLRAGGTPIFRVEVFRATIAPPRRQEWQT